MTHQIAPLALSLQDYSDAEELLAPANVDHEALCHYAHDAAYFSTGGKLPDLEFAKNHAGKADVAMFDFTCMHRAENASLVRERKGKKLLMGLVGDCLVEVGGIWGKFLVVHNFSHTRRDSDVGQSVLHCDQNMYFYIYGPQKMKPSGVPPGGQNVHLSSGISQQLQVRFAERFVKNSWLTGDVRNYVIHLFFLLHHEVTE